MPSSRRFIVLLLTVLFGGAITVGAASDLPKAMSEAKKQCEDAIHQADADANAKMAQALKAADEVLDRAMKAAMTAGVLQDANQIAALRNTLADASAPQPMPESIVSPEVRKAVEAYQASARKCSGDRAIARALASKAYIARLDQLLKQALHDEDLAGANQVAAIKKSAEIELKVGVGKFPNYPVALFAFEAENITQGERPRVIDLSGHGNDIDLDGSQKFVPGSSGTAIQLSLRKKLHTEQPVEISGHQPRTLSFWLRVEETPRPAEFNVVTFGGTEPGTQFGATMAKRHFKFSGRESAFDWTTPVLVDPKVWHYHAIVYDGSDVNWYIDGKSIGSHHVALNTKAGPLVIGDVVCQLQEIAIYDRVLRIDEINQLGHQSQTPGTPPTAVAPPVEVKESPINGEFFSLVGQAGLPQYTKCDQGVFGGLEGLHGGTVRTTATDYINKDFVFDVIFTLKQTARGHEAVVGIGEGGDRIFCRIVTDNPKCYAELGINGDRQGKHFADMKPDVPNLLRMEKKGDVLTFSVTGDFKGHFRPDFTISVPSIKSVAANLTHLNSNIFFGGEAFFKGVRLELDGKVVDPTTATSKFIEPAANEGWIRLEPGAELPSYLDGSAGVTFGKDGMDLTDKTIRTITSDYIEKDFTLDVLYDFRPDDRHLIHVGIGEDGNGVIAGLGGTANEGLALYTYHGFQEALQLGRLGKDHPGPHLFRFQKRGSSLLMSVCADYTDKYEPDFLVILPSLKWQAPYLTDKNTWLFLGSGGTVQRMRLIVDGKVIGGNDPRVTTANRPAIPPQTLPQTTTTPELISLAGAAGLPPFLRSTAETLANESGLVGGEMQTTAADLIDHDFVFDLLFTQVKGNKDFFVTLGHKLGEDAVGFRLNGVGGDGGLAVSIPRHDWVEMGKIGANLGPRLLRVEKRRNALIFSLCVDYQGTFTPSFVRSVPDLKSAVPMLTRLNSAIYVHGDATVVATRLSIDEKNQENHAGAVAGGGASTRPAIEGSIGHENFVNLTQKKLPDYFENQHDLKFSPEGLALKDAHLRTRAADFADKNFAFDVIFHFTSEKETLMLGIGANERDQIWIRKSVLCRVESPSAGGAVRITMDEAQDAMLGQIGNDPGPCLLRMQKRGNTLTFALCLSNKGTFVPTFVRTLPDLKNAAPFLNSKISRIFIGDGAVVEQTRLIVEGEATESHDIALDIPPRIVEGHPLRVHITKKPGFTFSVDGPVPAGLTLTPDGDLAWTPGHDQVGPHELKFKIADKNQNIAESANIEVVSTEDALAVKGDLAKVDSLYRLGLESDKAKIIPGLGGNSLLLLDGTTLRRLGADGIALLQTWKLPGTYQFIGERKGYFVAMSDETKSLDFIDKETMKITRSVQMDYFQRHDLCLNPMRPISYVSVAKASGQGGFIQSILIVDEINGDVHEPARFVGTFLKASADGTRLYAAYKDIYKRGEQLLFNPNNIDVIPVYGNIDILIEYDIRRPNQPIDIAAKNEAGGNGQGLALSADGKRISYLSFVGYPLHSNNIAAWDPNDLTKRPVSYPTKANNADCKKLAFHPLLPIAASPTESAAVCFDRESGKAQSDRLNFGTSTNEIKVHDLIFSPDGKNLILECESQGDFFLRRVRLNLDAEEVAKIKKGPPPVPLPAAPPENGDAPLRT